MDQSAMNRLQASLEEGEERLRLFIRNAPAAIAMFDRKMTYLAVSRRWLSDYRIPGETIVGRSHYDVFPEIPERWREIHQRALNGEELHADEDRFERADGRVQWLRWTVQPWRTAAGDVEGIVIWTEDITERKRTEEALELESRLPQENPAPVMRLMEGRVLSFANAAAERLLAAWGRTLGAEAPAEIVQVARAALVAGQKGSLEIVFDNRTYAVTVAPILPANYVNLYFIDVTDRKRIEREREELIRQLKKSQEDLASQVADLERFHDVAVGREVKMMELEKEIQRLKSRLADLQQK